MGSSTGPVGPRRQSYTTIHNRCFCLASKKYFFNYYILLEGAPYKAAETILAHFSPPLHTLNLLQAMGNLLYIIAVILVIIWAVSFFGGFFTGGIIHTLLVIAIIAILLRVISGRSAV